MSPELATHHHEHHHAHGPANRKRWIMPTAAPLFVRQPTGQPRAAVIVLHDARGLDEDVEQRCRQLAGFGYTAAAPYLYYENGGKEFRPDDEETAVAAMSVLSPHDLDADVSAAVAHLEEKAAIPPARIGVLGFGLGGYLAARACAVHALAGAAAVDPWVDEALPWHGVTTTAEFLTELRTPWLGIATRAGLSERGALRTAAGRSNGMADVHAPSEPAAGSAELGGWDEAVRFLQSRF
ncbi:dienelactone hydrolase family protein [Bounagaea algeriensis]